MLSVFVLDEVGHGIIVVATWPCFFKNKFFAAIVFMLIEFP